MSTRSEQLAAYARRAKANQPQQNEAAILRNRILDDGFRRLSEDLKAEFEKQIDELHKEPGCADTLIRTDFSENEFTVRLADDPECSFDVKFDAGKRSATISSERPTKFTRFIEVRLKNNETESCLFQGESRKDMGACPDDVGWMVGRALLALYGGSG